MSNKVKVYRTNKNAVVPEMKEKGSAGYDLCCLESFSMSPGQRVVVNTGLVVQPPEGYHTEIIVRSSMAFKHGIMLTNNVGVIDRSYSGPNDELKVMLFMCPEQPMVIGKRRTSVTTSLSNRGDVNFSAGDRIAQIVFRKTETFEFEETDTAPSDKARGGLGSTGR